MLTTLARSLASWPSGRSGWLWKSAEVITTPSTESPRNSSRSLVGRPPFSYAYDRWVSARSSSSGSNGTPNACSSGRVGGRCRLAKVIGFTSLLSDSRAAMASTAARRCRSAASAMPAARSGPVAAPWQTTTVPATPSRMAARGGTFLSIGDPIRAYAVSSPLSRTLPVKPSVTTTSAAAPMTTSLPSTRPT